MSTHASTLLNRIQLGEDTTLELKSVRFRGNRIEGPRRELLADEISAMANTLGGDLIFGVDDVTREVDGLSHDQLDAVEKLVFEVCTDTIKPALQFHTFRVELPDASGEMRPVLHVRIPRSLFVHQSPGGYLHRQGSTKRQMPPDLLARLFQQRSQARIIRFDEQVVPETNQADLEPSHWQRFVDRLSDPAEVALRKLKILSEDQDGTLRATVGGVLMCSRSPKRFLPGAFVQAVHYRGTRQDSNYQIDAAELDGPLDQQIVEAVAFVRRNMRVAGVRDVDERHDIPQFSLRAVFEAVVNAVAHRDYSVHGSRIRLFLFDDRLELYSPGALPNTLTVDSLALRQSTRNELIASLLARCPIPDDPGDFGRRRIMDKRGDGVPIIIQESERLGAPSPEWRVLDDAEVMLTVWGADGAA